MSFVIDEHNACPNLPIFVQAVKLVKQHSSKQQSILRSSGAARVAGAAEVRERAAASGIVTTGSLRLLLVRFCRGSSTSHNLY